MTQIHSDGGAGDGDEARGASEDSNDGAGGKDDVPARSFSGRGVVIGRGGEMVNVMVVVMQECVCVRGNMMV